LVICNLSKYAQPAEIDLRHFNGFIPVEMFSKNSFPLIKEDAPYFFTLSAHSFQWYVLEKAIAQKDDVSLIPKLELISWEELLMGNSRQQLEVSILPAYLVKRKWFKKQDRNINHVSIINDIKLDLINTVHILLLEITYDSGLPETYQLGLTYITEEEGHRTAMTHPEAIVALLNLNSKEAFLTDAFYVTDFHQFLIKNLGGQKEVNSKEETIVFNAKESVCDYLNHHRNLLAKMHSGDENNTSITFNNRFFLKMYRKVDATLNPDVELSSYLSDEGTFTNVPKFLGTIEWHTDRGIVVMGMLQELIENHGDGHSYMKERLNNFAERILARNRVNFNPYDTRGSITEPLSFEDLEIELQELIGQHTADMATLIGKRTAQMHLALANGSSKEFKPEEYSLHYQRSLFSTMQGLVREAFDALLKNANSLPEDLRRETNQLRGKKQELLDKLKNIYNKKLDIWKTRTHGTYNLRKLLMTGKDIVIQDFGGKPFRSYSERRIKRSPLRDVAEMIVSFHYVAYEGFFANNHIPATEFKSLLPFAEMWAHYVSGFFTKAYLIEVQGSQLIPKDTKELEIVLHTFLLEKSLVHFTDELNKRPEWSVVPLRMIKSILGIREQQFVVAYE
jgi:maltose alpha-D-glucosyltransferase / alpha-amylase